MNFLQSLADGISVAAILIIVAMGFAITFGVMKVINLAHGELIMIGAYTAYVFVSVLRLPFVLALVGAFVVSGLVGMVMEYVVIKRLYGRTLDTLLATLGISIILQQLAKLIFGVSTKSVSNPVSGSLHLGAVVIPNYRLFIILLSVFLLAVTLFILFKTNFGMKLRSVSMNRSICEVLGINTSRIDTLTFAFGSGLAGIAGAVLAPIRGISSTMGIEYLTDAFTVVVMGGVGSIAGTALGSALIGEFKQIVAFFSTEVSASILLFILVILVLRFKPEGLFKVERR
jgi:urea transport system permease protein